MTLDHYLEQFVEGYLLEDLRSMAPIRVALGKTYGAVGYPMLMTALSGIEVLGVLTSRAKFNPENGAARFGDFWRQYMYPDRPAFQRLDSLVYQFIRHGLAHSFMTMPIIRVTKHRDPAHLRLASDDVLCVDVLTLADELKTAYWQRLRPKITGDFRANMEARFNEVQQANWHERESKKHLLARAPRSPTFSAGLTQVSASTQVSSPSGGTFIHSTNVSTTGFDDPKR